MPTIISITSHNGVIVGLDTNGALWSWNSYSKAWQTYEA